MRCSGLATGRESLGEAPLPRVVAAMAPSSARFLAICLWGVPIGVILFVNRSEREVPAPAW